MAGKMDYNGRWLMIMATMTAAANSATQGYDGSMMNGLQILPSYEDYFKLSPALVSLNNAIVALGCIFAMPFGSVVCDRWGRKWGLAVTAFVAISAATIQGAAVHEAMFCIGRFMIGISLTLGTVAGTIYVSEIAHPSYRAGLTGLYGAFWFVGALMAALVTFGTQYIESTWSWRIPSLLQFLPSLLCLLQLPFLPESPRWLVFEGRYDEAKAMLIKYHGNGDPDSKLVALEYEEICQTLEHEKNTQQMDLKALVATKPARWRLGVVLCISVFCQLSGNNTISYYLGDVLDTAGITQTDVQLAINIGLTTWNLGCAIFGSWLVDRVSRRLSFIGATLVMAGALVIMSILTKLYFGKDNSSASAAIVFLIFFFYSFYSIVWTPLSWTYPNEVLSYSLRAKGWSAFMGVSYAATFLNLYAIPYAMAWSGWGFYLISAGWCVLECVVMFFYFPETSGMTLEEIDIVFDGIKHFDGEGVNGIFIEGQEVIQESSPIDSEKANFKIGEKDIETV